MVTLKPDTTATFFFVTDGRATDQTSADSPMVFAVDSSATGYWWYSPSSRVQRPAQQR